MKLIMKKRKDMENRNWDETIDSVSSDETRHNQLGKCDPLYEMEQDVVLNVMNKMIVYENSNESVLVEYTHKGKVHQKFVGIRKLGY